MIIIDEATVRRHLSWPKLIDAIGDGFRQGAIMPLRQHYTIPVPDDPDATLLLMACWSIGGYIGVKIANIFPGNVIRGNPAVAAGYILMSATTGDVLAYIEAGELTSRRTAAASALAARTLAPANAKNLLVIGTGRLAPYLAQAHATVRQVAQITVWGRSHDKAKALAARLQDDGLPAQATTDLQAAVAAADIITCATLSAEPLVRGEWLSPGTHIDLVGGFTPAMREADDDAIRRARVYVDTRDGALKEAGDIAQPLASGVITTADIAGDLFDLASGTNVGRQSETEITLFKSVGAAIEDLAAAVAVYQGIEAERD
ncbi:MAG: ornithine cyclodeaminase family protein [Alphaproteobacteria bacterium]